MTGKIKWSKLAPFFLFLTSFVIYLNNLSIGSFGGDVGDFLSVIATRGIAHPSGYPLYTIIGIIFSYIPIGPNLAYKVSLFSALISSFSVILFYFISNILIKNKLISFISALFLSFIYPFWLYAEVSEAFALSYFFILLLLYLAIYYAKSKDIRFLYWLSFFMGLSLSHHETILLTYPTILIIVIANTPKNYYRVKRALFYILLFLLGLLPYVYLPIASFFKPAISWNNPSQLNDFIRLILRSDYGWEMTKSPDIKLYLLSIKYLFVYLFREITMSGSLMIIIGIIFSFLNKRKILSIALLIGFILNGPLFVVYGYQPLVTGFNHGIMERFYVFSFLFLLVFFPIGVNFIKKLIMLPLVKIKTDKKRLVLYENLIILCFLIIPVSLFIVNFSKTDLHNVRLSDNLAKDILRRLPKNTILFTTGDTPIFNIYYLQYGENFRKDVSIVNINRPYGNKILRETREKFEKFNKNKSNDELNALVINDLYKKYPIYSSAPLESAKKNVKRYWVPDGLLLKLSDQEIKNKNLFLTEQEKIWENLSFTENKKMTDSERSNLLSRVNHFYANSAYSIAYFLINEFKDYDNSEKYFYKSIKYNDNQSDAYKGLGYLYLMKNNCAQSEIYLNKALSFNPSSPEIYKLKYALYAKCFKNLKKAKEVEKRYKEIFKKQIYSKKEKTD